MKLLEKFFLMVYDKSLLKYKELLPLCKGKDILLI